MAQGVEGGSDPLITIDAYADARHSTNSLRESCTVPYGHQRPLAALPTRLPALHVSATLEAPMFA